MREHKNYNWFFLLYGIFHVIVAIVIAILAWSVWYIITVVITLIIAVSVLICLILDKKIRQETISATNEITEGEKDSGYIRLCYIAILLSAITVAITVCLFIFL